MIQSRAIRAMTAAGAPWAKGLRIAGRIKGASLARILILVDQRVYDRRPLHVHRGTYPFPRPTFRAERSCGPLRGQEGIPPELPGWFDFICLAALSGGWVD